MRIAVFVLLLSIAGAARSESWQADVLWNPDVLQMWQMEVVSGKAAQPHAHPQFPHYRGWRWRGHGSSDGRTARIEGGFDLRRGERRLRLDVMQLRPDVDGNVVFLEDRRGRPWLVAEMPHRMPGAQFDWRYMNLRLLPAAARRLGDPTLVEAVLGVLELRGPRTFDAKGSRSCRAEVVWPAPETPADISLSAIGSVVALRCRTCQGDACRSCDAASSDGEVVVAPDAALLNVGSSDVPWYPKFHSAAAPHGNDQHPYLVWALYRLDADGGIVPLGSSGVKHAFFAQNDLCNCFGDTTLYRGCSDLYSAGTNDAAGVLGPREEIDPRSGLWGRCGSVFDPDCNGVENTEGFARDGYSRRLRALESDLLASLNPGAQYFIEAWYVVRDDAVLDNSFAHRRVLPTKNSGGSWSFPVQEALGSGPLLHRWVDPEQPGAMARSSRLAHSNGRVQLAVRVDSLPDQRFRYRYALMNLDYAETAFDGEAPNQRVLSQRGLRELVFPLPPDLVDGLRWRDDDRNPDNDWQVAEGTELRLQAADSGGLGWGRMATLEFTSAAPPVEGKLRLGLGASDQRGLASLLPDGGLRVFADGFEPRPAAD